MSMLVEKFILRFAKGGKLGFLFSKRPCLHKYLPPEGVTEHFRSMSDLKRKRTMLEEVRQHRKDINDIKRQLKKHKKDINEGNENMSENEEESIEENSTDRAAIIALAKVKPALCANIGLTWFKALEKEFHKEYFAKLGEFLLAERKKYTIYPPEEAVYAWTHFCKINEVQVVILGQDPYHGPHQAHGLAFSVHRCVPVPPSLTNIYAEMKNDIHGLIPTHGCLIDWAKQGVLLLNSCLTVRAGAPNSHRGKGKGGWEEFTDAVITWINNNLSNVVFMLWGKDAERKGRFINKDKHLVLTAPHPSPLSAHRGFFGCSHFSKANQYLQEHNKTGIDWKVLY